MTTEVKQALRVLETAAGAHAPDVTDYDIAEAVTSLKAAITRVEKKDDPAEAAATLMRAVKTLLSKRLIAAE